MVRKPRIIERNGIFKVVRYFRYGGFEEISQESFEDNFLTGGTLEKTWESYAGSSHGGSTNTSHTLQAFKAFKAPCEKMILGSLILGSFLKNPSEFLQAVVFTSGFPKVSSSSPILGKTHRYPCVNSENLQVARSKMNCGCAPWHRESM